MYANASGGALYPAGLGDDVPKDQRWPVHVFKPAVWNPDVLKCPSDPLELLDPDGSRSQDHSYLLNGHLAEEGIRLGTKVPGLSASDVVVMGEKVTTVPDYYMGARKIGKVWGSEYYRVVERFRHGTNTGSNYLYLDWHVANVSPAGVADGIDAWDVSPLDPNR
jgi:prepilin-type processing-associated H-X9-DG protein